MALIGGLVLVLAGTGAAVVMSVTSTPPGSATPEEALRAYLTADATHDCEELVRHPIAGYADLDECEEAEAEHREEDLDHDIDPDSRVADFEVMDVDDEGDVVTFSIDYEESYLEDGETQYSGNFRGYEVVQDDDGTWAVTELTFED